MLRFLTSGESHGPCLVAILEGGYSREAVAAAVVATCQVLTGQTAVGEPLGQPPERPTPPAADRVLAAAREVHHL